MALNQRQMKYVPRDVREWDRFFDQLVVEADGAAADSIENEDLQNDSVTTDKVADGNVTTAKIADANVTTNKVADSNITTAKVADSNITTAKIADANITTTKLADGNVTLAKLADLTADRILGRLSTGGVPQELTATQVRDFILQVTAITDASEAHSLNATFDNTEVQNALNALGAKINLILDELLKST